MKILQNTTDFSNKQVREIIDFVKPNNLPTWNFDVRLTHCTCGAGNGVYYDGQQNYTGHVNGEYGEYIIVGRPHIMLRVARENGKQKFPYYEDRSPKVRRPWRKVTLHYEKFNPKTQQYEEWHYTKRYQSIKDKEKTMTQGGYISHLTLSRAEYLVYLIAHELRHHWQTNHLGKRGKVWGARGKVSETDADAYAIRKKREWRKLHTPTEIYPDDNILFA